MISFNLDNDDGGESDDQSVLKEKIKKECGKSQPKLKRIERWMVKTYSTRRTWIVNKCPATNEIIDQYPAFNHSQSVSRLLTRLLIMNIV